MSLKTPSGRMASRSSLVDAALEGYLAWRVESTAVAASYHDWTRAPRDARAGAFRAYVAALDREEHAASAYQRLLAQSPAV